MSKSAVKHNRTIFVTLKAVVASRIPLSVNELQQATGFDKRMVQRHVEVLKDVGVIARLGAEAQSGYRYTSALPISAG
ncbi:MAG: HTH domain-containing protein [Psychrobacter sp.]|nr:HTH domain-containing protein [Psychrobacter sp.]